MQNVVDQLAMLLKAQLFVDLMLVGLFIEKLLEDHLIRMEYN